MRRGWRGTGGWRCVVCINALLDSTVAKKSSQKVARGRWMAGSMEDAAEGRRVTEELWESVADEGCTVSVNFSYYLLDFLR